MSLFQQWQDLISNQTDDTFKEFWTEYSAAETAIYTDILTNYKEGFQGIIGALALKSDTTEVIFMGFLDGINTSLEAPLDLEALTEDSEIDLKINFEKLFFNMLEAKADYLFSIPQWENVLTPEQLTTIATTYKKSRTIVKEKLPGRNDPCPCGSGKKYKKCCGAN